MGCYSGKTENQVKKSAKISKVNELVVNPSTFAASNESLFQVEYQIGSLLATSALGEVRVAVHNQSRRERAVKIVRKELIKNATMKQRITQEFTTLKTLDHPNVIRVFESFEDSKRYYRVMELSKGGELFDELMKRRSFSEKHAAKIMKQLFSAVGYLHSQGVAHRDLKPENILLELTGEDLHITLIGFGAAAQFSEHTHLTGVHGTAYYVAPEVMQGQYTERCDCWSAGVILYILLSGSPPFDGDTDKEILECVKTGEFSFPSASWDSVSPAAQDLITQLLAPPETRLSAIAALQHNWIVSNTANGLTEVKMESICANLRNFQSPTKLRDAVHTYIAGHCLSVTDTKELREAFVKIDTNGDGRLSRDELLTQYQTTMSFVEAEEEVTRIMGQVDTDHSGFIDYTEFLKATMDTRKVMSIENLRLAFDLFDKDGSGSISANEIRKVLQGASEATSQVWNGIIKEVDMNGDGEIDLYEFEEIILRSLQ